MAINDLNEEIFGKGHMRKVLIKSFFRDFKSYFYLLKKFQFRLLYNFLYTKLIVPTGEGFFLGLYRFKMKRPLRIPVPKFFEIETTTVCNKRCYICEYNYWPKNEQVKRHLKLDEYAYILDQFPKVRWSNLTGEGSSFLNKDYSRMLQHLWNKHRASIWFVDHLSDITIDELENQVLPYAHGIYLSIDGATKETYEKIKIGCNFDNVINNLKCIVEYKRKHKTPFPHITFRYVILKDNVHELPLFVDLVNSLAQPHEWGGSATRIEFTGLLYFKNIMQYYVEQIPRNIIEELLKRKGAGIDFVFAHAEEEKNPPIECCNAWLEPYLMLPGYMLPCCAVMMSNNRPFLRKHAFGNVFKNTVGEIWTNDYYTKFKTIINDPCAPVPKICVGCRAFRTQERVKRNGVWDVYQDAECAHTEIADLDLTFKK